MIRAYFYNLSTDKTSGLSAFFIKFILWLLSVLYGAVIRVISVYNARRAVKPACRVISIGNITWGGTGKTPLVEFVASELLSLGRKAAVLTRGYKSRKPGSSGGSVKDAVVMGDEPYMLSRKLSGIPVIVNKDRIKGADEAVKVHGCDTVILDDGFQQWKVVKDLDIVAIDSGNPFGNGCLIPRGIMREPFGALKRADIFVLTNSRAGQDNGLLKKKLARINPRALIAEGRHKPVYFYKLGGEDRFNIMDFKPGGPVMLVSGIGNPDSFRGLVGDMGINVAGSVDFADHHSYGLEDAAYIARKAREFNTKIAITTEKDAGKLAVLRDFSGLPAIYVLGVSFEITENEEQFFGRLRGLYTS